MFRSLSNSLLGWGLTCLFVCSLASVVAAAPADDKQAKDPAVVFKKLDTDGDGFLTVEEFIGKRTDEKAERAKKAFARKDKDADGKLSLEEFSAQPKKKNE